MPDALGYIEHLQADALERFDRHYDHWFAFPQTHSDTSLGFGGMAGQMVTTAQTVILTEGHSRAAVYFGGRFAYEATYREAVEYTRALHAPTMLQRVKSGIRRSAHWHCATCSTNQADRCPYEGECLDRVQGQRTRETK